MLAFPPACSLQSSSPPRGVAEPHGRLRRCTLEALLAAGLEPGLEVRVGADVGHHGADPRVPAEGLVHPGLGGEALAAVRRQRLAGRLGERAPVSVTQT